MEFSRLKNIFIVLIMSVFLSSGMLFMSLNGKIDITGQNMASVSTGVLSVSQDIVPEISAYVPPEKLINPPKIVKAVYVTGYSAGSKKYLNYLKNLFKTTEINSVVVDIKGSGGEVSYVVKNNIDELVKFFHDKNIYVIGRIVVFEDPIYSKIHPEWAIYNKAIPQNGSAIAGRVLWKDNNGQSWLDPASKDVWNYNISLAKNAFYHGFDEINFDYVRFPSDGNIKNMGFPVWDGKKSKSGIIKEFFQYLRSELANERISVDLFGQTTVDLGDMGIGQILEDAFENFDYISPMVYPSHYASKFIGFENPAQHPYEVIKYCLDIAKKREDLFLSNNIEATGTPASDSLSNLPLISLAKFRPWLQDFNMGAVYNAMAVSNEIQATKDSLGKDYNGFMLWNPNNVYTKGAILRSDTY